MQDDELICPCFGVTVLDVKNAIKNGASTFEEVQDLTNLGFGCAMCIDSAQIIVDELLKNK